MKQVDWRKTRNKYLKCAPPIFPPAYLSNRSFRCFMTSKRLLIWSIIAAALILSGVIFYPDFEDWFFFAAFAVQWGLWSLASVIVVVVLWRILRGPAKLTQALILAPVVLAAAAAELFPEILSEDLRFHLLRPYYEIQVVRAHAGHLHSPDAEFDGGLIAFHVTDGLLDNWIAVVYDPGDSLVLNRSIERFDGEMYCSARLASHWYSCGFT